MFIPIGKIPTDTALLSNCIPRGVDSSDSKRVHVIRKCLMKDDVWNLNVSPGLTLNVCIMRPVPGIR